MTTFTFTDDQLAAIQARVDAITKGNWYAADDGSPAHADHEEEVNSVFIAAAPDDIRDLLAEVRRLKALVGEGSDG